MLRADGIGKQVATQHGWFCIRCGAGVTSARALRRHNKLGCGRDAAGSARQRDEPGSSNVHSRTSGQSPLAEQSPRHEQRGSGCSSSGSGPAASSPPGAAREDPVFSDGADDGHDGEDVGLLRHDEVAHDEDGQDGEAYTQEQLRVLARIHNGPGVADFEEQSECNEDLGGWDQPGLPDARDCRQEPLYPGATISQLECTYLLQALKDKYTLKDATMDDICRSVKQLS